MIYLLENGLNLKDHNSIFFKVLECTHLAATWTSFRIAVESSQGAIRLWSSLLRLRGVYGVVSYVDTQSANILLLL